MSSFYNHLSVIINTVYIKIHTPWPPAPSTLQNVPMQMFDRILNKPWFLNMPGFWIYLSSQYPTLRKNWPYLKLFWSVFSRIRTKYGEIRSIFPYSVRMRENTDQNNSKYGFFSRSASVLNMPLVQNMSGFWMSLVLNMPGFWMY